LAFYTLKKYKDNLSSRVSQLYSFRLVWTKQFITCSFIVCSAISVIIYLMYYHYPHWQNLRFSFVALSVFIYCISYKAWSHPELLSVIHGYSTNDLSPMPRLTIHLPQKKYSNSNLGEDDQKRIITALE